MTLMTWFASAAATSHTSGTLAAKVYFRQNDIHTTFTTIFASFYFEIHVNWSKAQRVNLSGVCVKHR